MLTPDEAIKELHRRRRQVRQIEWAAHHEGEELDAEIKLIMGVAAELTGVATFCSGATRVLDEAALRRDYEELCETYMVVRPTRPFKIRW